MSRLRSSCFRCCASAYATAVNTPKSMSRCEKNHMRTKRLLWVIGLPAAVLCFLLPFYLARQRAEREEALFQAIERGDYQRTTALLKAGVNVNARRLSNPPVPWKPLQDLQTRWEYPDYPFQIGYTPLMIACQHGDARIARLLLNRGADTAAIEREHEGRTALVLAVEYEHSQVVQLLLNYGADPNGSPGTYGPLLAAWREQDHSLEELLLTRGAKPLPAALKKPLVTRR